MGTNKLNDLNEEYRATGVYQFIEKTNALVLGGIIALVVGLFKKLKK